MWEFFNTTAGAATIVGLIVTLGGWWSGHGTHRLTRQVDPDTQQLLNAINAHAHERHQEDMREIKTDQPAYPNDYMQEDPMNGDDLTKTLGRSLTRLTWTVNRWGAAITILLAIILILSGTPIRGDVPRLRCHRPR